MRTGYIIAGITGAIGNAYLSHLASGGESVIGLARSSRRFWWPNTVRLDLLDVDGCRRFVRALDLREVDRIVLLHLVGKFDVEWEESSFRQDIWDSNLTTFTNLAALLLEKADTHGVAVKFVAFGSPSDREPPRKTLWPTFTKSMNEIRRYMEGLSSEHSGLMVNISSTDTPSERKLRPFADRTRWLSPKEVVERSVVDISSIGGTGHRQIEVFNPDPGFDSYYDDFGRIKAKWKYEMYGR